MNNNYLGEEFKEYFEELEKRSKKSRVYRSYQALGLTLASMLSDLKHKALYIKLAKQMDGQRLMSLAKRIAEKKGIINRGAYFMKVLKAEGFWNDAHNRRKQKK